MHKWLFLLGALATTVAHANAPFFSTHFGNNGATRVAFDVLAHQGVAGSNDDGMRAAALLPDGRLVVGGMANTQPEFESNGVFFSPFDFAIARLLPNGQPDPAFGNNGQTVLGVAAENGLQFGVVLDLASSGAKLTYVGEIWKLNSPPTGVVGRLSDNGSPDPAFNGNGRRLFTPGAFAPGANDFRSLRLKFQPDGKLLVAASVINSVTSQACVGIERLLPPGANDGLLDPSFGQGQGLICVAPPLPGGTPVAFGGDLALLPDGRILVGATVSRVGGSGLDMGVARLHSDGSLDTSFGNNGWAFAAFDQGGTLDDAVAEVAVDANGRILLDGAFRTDDDGNFGAGIARFSANGVLDDGFGTHGTARLASGAFSAALDMALLPDGRILLGGQQDDQGMLLMLTDRGVPDPHFGTAGVFTESFVPQVLRLLVSGAFLYLIGNNVRIDPNGTPNSDFAISKYLWNAIFADGMERFNPQA